MLSLAGKFDRDLCSMKQIMITHNTRVSLCCWHVVHGIIKSLVQQQVFLQSMASLHLSKQWYLRTAEMSTLFHDHTIVYRFYSGQALGRAIFKRILIAGLLTFLASRLRKLYFTLKWWNLHFKQLSFQCVKKVIKSSCSIFFLTLIAKIIGAANLWVLLIHEYL